MKVKNISGNTLTFKAGVRTYVLNNSGETTTDDTLEAFNDAYGLYEKGLLEITEGLPALGFLGSPAREGYADLNLNSTLADADTLTIAGVVFEFDTVASNSVSGTNIRVVLVDPADAPATAANLKAAINGNAHLASLGLVAEDILPIGSTNAKLILKAKGSTDIDDVTITQVGDGVDIVKVSAESSKVHRTSVVEHTATGTTALIYTGLVEVQSASVGVKTAAGASKAYDGTITYGGGFVYLDASGDADIASTDVVTVVAYGK